MFSIHIIFKSLKESFCQLTYDQVKNFCYVLRLNESDEFEAMLAAGFESIDDKFDLQEARDVLGKEDVDSWLKEGYWFDDFHPLYQDPEGIWAVCQWNTGEVKKISEPVDMMSIPTQTKYSVRDFKIKYSIKGNLKADKIESIVNHECIKTVHYGYLLQSKKHSTSDVISDCELNIMIDSNLLKRVRDAIYKYPTAIIRDSLSHNNRTEYFIMKAFLTPVNHIEFLSLFPHFKSMFEQFQIIFDLVVNTILQMRQRQLMSDDDTSNVDTTSALNCVASLLLDYIIKRDLTFNPINADAKKIIRDFILKSEYAMIFLKLI